MGIGLWRATFPTEGFAMKKILITAAACGMAAGSVVSAGPAWAHADDGLIQYKEPNPEWVMPDLKDEILFTAEADVEGVVDQLPLTFKMQAPNHEAVYNLEDWVVCGESPKAGSALSAQKTKSVTLLLERPGGEACGT